jgi:membrane protease YdiL (CAAX protease family)
MMYRFVVFLKNAFAIKRSSAKDYIFAAAGVIILTLLSLGQLLADNFDYKTPEVMTEVANNLSGGPGGVMYFTLFVICILAPIAEELVFRGALWSYVSSKVNLNFAFIITTILFAAAHQSPVHIAGVLPLSVWLGFVRYRSGSILPCIFAHALNNVIVSTCIIAA